MLDSLYLRLADLSPAALIIIPLAISSSAPSADPYHQKAASAQRHRLPHRRHPHRALLPEPDPQPMIEKTDFLADLALCFIAFSAGEFFKLETLRKNG